MFKNITLFQFKANKILFGEYKAIHLQGVGGGGGGGGGGKEIFFLKHPTSDFLLKRGTHHPFFST